MSMELERLRIVIRGQVQGVGFRPYVYRLAKQLQLTGWIQNNASGVLIEIQGVLAYQFTAHLKKHLPPLAKISHLQADAIGVIVNDSPFKIVASQDGKANTLISPDTSICQECMQELFDPQSRYYLYPFLNCTHCGPRLTITYNLPYDRCKTSMSSFLFCKACEEAYHDPENRRYHAQPSACVHCGPHLSLTVNEIAQYIKQGEIIALKAQGGYQLICDARNKATVLKLRARKNREAKPFALMVANRQSAEPFVEISTVERDLMEGATRPIVLLRKKQTPDEFGTEIAPGLNSLGVMLPYTPLHYLLFYAFAKKPTGCDWLNEMQSMILVVTSANVNGEPLIIDDHSAEKNLKSIADKIISYNRHIVTRTDDSVVRLVNHTPMFIRRSRGYVPSPIQLPRAIPSTLALGGHLKNTLCVTRGNEAFVSQHIGDLNNKATIDFFHETLSHLLKFLDVKPERVAHDLHPDFYTTRVAEQLGIPTFAIQHHHAHLASVAAEHGIEKPVLGLVLDGYGYGGEGDAWGGELFLLAHEHVTRIGCFAPLLQPGGEIAAREPWRMAASVLHHLGRSHEITKRFSNQPQASTLHQLLDKKINCPGTSSCGRLFDAASALSGVLLTSRYEGEAAMRLESLVTQLEVAPNGWRIQGHHFDMLPTLELLSNMSDPVSGSNLFHGTLIAGLTTWILKTCRETNIDMIVLSGGCFLNQILAEGLTKALSQSGIISLLPRDLPPNDGGISLGQAWIAGITG